MRCWTDIEKQGRQYLDEADNGKWVYPACKRTASDAGADKDQVCNHTRLEAVRYLLTVPRGKFAGRTQLAIGDTGRLSSPVAAQ